MIDHPHYTDETLTAFLDAELSADQAAAVKAAMADQPELAARLVDLGLSKSDLQDGFAAMLAAAPPMPALAQLTQVQSLAWRGLAAALALGLALGAGVWSIKPDTRSWMDYVAAYQLLYVPATLTDVSPTEAETVAQLADLSARLGLDLKDVRAVPSLQFKRGQELGYQGQLLVQLAFQTADGTPIALCILRHGTAAAPFAAGQYEGLKTVAWAQDGFGFFLIGGSDAAALIAAAEKFAAAI